jgi:hypothetical protein
MTGLPGKVISEKGKTQWEYLKEKNFLGGSYRNRPSEMPLFDVSNFNMRLKGTLYVQSQISIFFIRVVGGRLALALLPKKKKNFAPWMQKDGVWETRGRARAQRGHGARKSWRILGKVDK